MGISNRGFASLGAERRKQVSSKGGRTAHASGKAYTYDTESARAAGIKSADTRKQGKASQAAARLFKAGFTPTQLKGLSLDEFIYFGGPDADAIRLAQLRARVDKSISNIELQPADNTQE